MKILMLATLILVLIIVFRSLQGTRQGDVTDQPALPDAAGPDAEAGRRIRKKMLTTPANAWGVTPSAEFPRVFAVLMDWPATGQIISIFCAHDGTASLYTTGSFGVIGAGERSASVRTEAINFVHLAERSFEAAAPTADTRYPSQDRVRFYLIGFDGLRVIEIDRRSLERGDSKYNGLFDQGQVVMAQIRKVHDQMQ